MKYKLKRSKVFGVMGVMGLLVVFVISCKEDVFQIQSPDENFELKLTTSSELNGLFYSVKYKDYEIVQPSRLGIEFDNKIYNSQDFKIKKVELNTVNSVWETIYGERKVIPENYNEGIITVKSKTRGFSFLLRIRAYNEGVAFRYEFNQGDTLNIVKELTEFNLLEHATAWGSEEPQGAILRLKVSELTEIYNRPLLLQYNDSLFAALGEASNVDFARMNFAVKNASEGILKVDLTNQVTSEVGGKKYPCFIPSGKYETPWRFVMAGKTAGELVENNYLILNLNEENKIKNTDWIRPGKVIREVTLTTDGGIACIDFAVKNNLQFILFDAGWYGHEYDDSEDATTVTVDPSRSPGPLDLEQVIQYGKKKGIGVILYVNRRALEKQLDDVLDFASKLGAVGIKYGFVNVGPQEWTDWLHEAVRKAAEHNLMIDIHDEYRPTGYSRTYPNLMTQEGIRGDEESTPNAMVLNTVFTRMIAGAGDQTNCYFSERIQERMGSHASQMAKTICIYSPWQFLFWYDRPLASPTQKGEAGGSLGRILDIPDISFYAQVPTVWDETKVLEGYPGEYVVIARKNKDNWYVGVLNGHSSREISIDFSFLDEDKEYEMIRYYDDKLSLSPTKVGVDSKKCKQGEIQEYHLGKSNGMALVIKAL